MCGSIPIIKLKTRICLVVHHRELTRSSNTGVLAVRALVNSEMRVRGEAKGALNLSDLITPQYRTFLLFPSDGAVELDRELVALDRTPIQLIVPDGTWRQARKVHYRHPELKDVPRVKIAGPNNTIFQLRAQNKPERMVTLQAVAQALGVIEGEGVERALMALYREKVERTLMGRGLLSPSRAAASAGTPTGNGSGA